MMSLTSKIVTWAFFVIGSKAHKTFTINHDIYTYLQRGGNESLYNKTKQNKISKY